MLSCDKLDSFADYCVSGGRLNAYKAVLNANMYAISSINIRHHVELSSGNYKWFKFTATVAGSYTFCTEYTESELDTIGELFPALVADDSISGRLAYCDDPYTADDGDNTDYNFSIVYYLAAGETVYLRISSYDTGSCNFRITRV